MRRFISVLVCTTLAGLFYVALEVEAVKVGYEIRRQEETKIQALDRARALKYNVARLKAPHNLERRLLAQRILLETPKEWQTLVLSGGPRVHNALKAGLPINQQPFFTKFLVGTAQAEAKDS